MTQILSIVRRIGYGLGVAVAIGLLVSAEPIAAESAPFPSNLAQRITGSDWPTFLGPTGDSKSSETGIVTDWTNPGSLRIVWQKNLGTSYGAPTISRGRLFQFDRFGNKARVYALNAETGEPLWQYEYKTEYVDSYGYNNGPRCSVVVDEDRAYAYGVEGMLVCLSVTDGKELWKIDTSEKYGVVQNFFGVGSTPVIEGDLIICMVGGSSKEAQALGTSQLNLVEGNGSGLVAFDKRTGVEKYRLTDELASYASLKLATINKRRWCFAFCRGGLVGFEPASGKLDFEFPWRAKSLESVNASMPVVVGSEVFISETYGPGSALLDVQPKGSTQPAVVWQDSLLKRDKALQTHWNTPVYHDGFLYGSSGRHTGNAELRCLDWKTGKVQWSEPGLTRASLMYVDGHFVCLAENGDLTLIKANPKKYELVTQAKLVSTTAGPNLPGAKPAGRPLLTYPCWAAPVLSHGLLCVRGDDRLLCLELIPTKE